MKQWLLGCIGLGLTGLVLAADPPKAVEAPKKVEVIPEAEQGEGVSLTVYNQDFVVVKERRLMDLKRGRSTVRFRDVAATIVPETVQFAALRQADLARVVEQNYEFDLVSADKLLDKYIDRDISLVARDGDTLKGRLLSFDANQLVLQTANGIDMVPRGSNVKDVQFTALPGGLLTRPTLVWELDARNGGKELVKVAYRADKMSWHVDYRARINEAGDKLDLAGWVTLTNNTGTTYRDAQVKLMAGDVHLVQPTNVVRVFERGGNRDAAKSEKQAAGFTEKSFAEYHRYELGRKATLKERETKQIELLNVESIPVTRHYAYRGEGTKVAVLLEFKNSEKTTLGLGIPFPKGPIRVFQHDLDGELEFSGADRIDHTPKDELLKVRQGYAFDLAGERKQVAFRGGANQNEQDIEIRLRNHKTEAVTIDVTEPINGHTNWVMLRNSHPFVSHDVKTLVFPVDVKPNSEVVVTYSIRYTW